MKARTAAAYLPKILLALGCLMAVMGARAQTAAPVDSASPGSSNTVQVAAVRMAAEPPARLAQAQARDADPARIERAENRKMIAAWLGIPEAELNSMMRLVRATPEERRVAAATAAVVVAAQESPEHP